MKTVDKTANLSQTKAVFKKYVTNIVKILAKRIKMTRIKKGYNGDFRWESHKNKVGCPYDDIIIYFSYHRNCNTDILDLFISINYSSPFCTEYLLEETIREETINKIHKKYPLTAMDISMAIERQKKVTLNLSPAKEVAKQLFLALKCFAKISNSKTDSKIKKIRDQTSKLIKKEASAIAESFFQ